MNVKKIAVGLISSAMVLTMGIGSYAASEVEEIKILDSAIEIVSNSLEKGNVRMPLTEAQIEEKQAEVEAQMEKWEALSESEKSQIYDISEKSRDVLKEMVQKYLDLELIDQDEADQMLEHIEAQADMEQEEGCMPELGMRGFGRGKSMMMKEGIPATATTMSSVATK